MKDKVGTQTAISSMVLVIISILLFNTDSLLATTFGILAVFFSGIALGTVIGKNKN